MSLCEHGKYEGHCSICIENIPAEPVYTDPRMMGIDAPTPDSERTGGIPENICGVCYHEKNTNNTCSVDSCPNKLYTIEAVIKMVMEHPDLEICNNKSSLYFQTTEAVINLIQMEK